jgi:uncharacterized protein with FMN-binding domain
MAGKTTHVLKALFYLFVWGLIVLPSISGCISSEFVRDAGLIPGVYDGVGQGRRGPVRVRLQISPAGIEDVVIVNHRESIYPGAVAMEELLEEILETGSTDLDAVSGATFSSIGFLEAVEDALRQASAP